MVVTKFLAVGRGKLSIQSDTNAALTLITRNLAI